MTSHLAEVAKHLEKQRHEPERVARFLMRCLFTMFAESVELLPEKLFTRALETQWSPRPATFQAGVEHLWRTMHEGGPFGAKSTLLRFGGGLFADPFALPLGADGLTLLLATARCAWSDVEPAVFGTLLERALSEKERHELGAHFTPRAYVERLVRPTVEEPVRTEWDSVRAAAHALRGNGDVDAAKEAVHAFHRELCETRVLDPACGSGNFLYVTLDILQQIEGEVLALLADLGEGPRPLLRVTPRQLLGIEVKPWAKEIAEIVLWIGYWQGHHRARGQGTLPPEPVLQDFDTIECRDAVLAWDEGRPRRAAWPKASFIVGNPPYLGARHIRATLGDDYVNALRAAYPDVPETADLVMYFWHRAAEAVENEGTRRFGLITTNSIVQAYSRRVLDDHLSRPNGVSIVFAIPDHPWALAADGAAVRVAMTVGVARNGSGGPAHLGQVTAEGPGTDAVQVALESVARIGPALTSWSPALDASRLTSNSGICYQGVVPAGDGFKMTLEEIRALGHRPDRLPRALRRYVIGRDLVQRPDPKFIIDFFGSSGDEARQEHPDLFQRLVDRVYPERLHNKRAAYREKWWWFAEPRPAMRKALAGLERFIVTPYTAKHRPFLFVPGDTLPDAMAYAIACDDAALLGVLSSKAHRVWCLATGGTLEDRPRYNSDATFLRYPFPAGSDSLQRHVRDLGEQLDVHRKARQAAHPDLTITGMYNVLEKLRTGAVLTGRDHGIHEDGKVSFLKKIHDDLDGAVFAAYGWPPDLTDEQILARLVALNAERAAEEKHGLIRWLRPDVQAAIAGAIGSLRGRRAASVSR